MSDEAAASSPHWSVDHAATSRDEPPRLATSARYTRGELLGVGGMGAVYVAYDHELDRHVALKELKTATTGAGRDAMKARLLREARLTARLDHPGVVSVFDVGELADGALFYTMRIVRGQSLAATLQGAARDPSGRVRSPARERLLRALLSACDAVGFGHRLGVVHRDLKPGNIMIGEFGETQVVDWGLALALDEGDARERRGVAGTPAYMSPEQARGAEVDARSDVWSLGAILHELATGRAPHMDEAGANTPTELVTKAGHRPVPRLTGVEPELAAIVDRALALDPEARYEDAKALAVDLANHLDGRRVAAHDYSSWELLARLVRAWRGPLAAVALALVAGGVSLGVGFQRAEDERARAQEAERAAVQARARAQDAEVRAVAALAESTRNLHAMLVSRAVALHREGARPEAEVLAARALELAPSPEAHAVLLAQGLAPRPDLIAEVALPAGCDENTVLDEGRAIVCRTPVELALWDLAPPRLRWRRDLPNLHVPVALGDGALVTVDRGRVVVLEPRTGEVRASFEAYGPVGLGEDALVVALWSLRRMILVDRAGRSAALEACDEPQLDQDAGVRAGAVQTLDHEGGVWAIACGDGTLNLGTFEAGASALRMTSRHEAPTTLRWPAAIAFSPDGRSLLVAEPDGRVSLLGLDGRVTVRFSLTSRLAPVRALAISPDGRLGLVRGERAGIALLDLETGSWLTRLPLASHRSARFVGPRELVTTGATLDRWRLPEPAPLVLEHGAGVASVALVGDRAALRVGVGAGAMLERWRWSEGLAVTREAPVDLAGITVKSLVSVGDTLLAVSSGLDGIAQVPWQGGELGGFGRDRARRVVRLVEQAPTPGGPDAWIITASYGPAVFAIGLAHDAPLRGVPGLPEELPVPWFDDEFTEHQDLTAAPGEHAAVLLAVQAQRARRVVARGGVSVDRELDVGPALAAALERDGETLWTVTYDRLERWDLETGALLASIAVPEVGLLEVAVADYTPTDVKVAAGDRLGGTWLWSVVGDDVTLVAHFADHAERVAALAFGPAVDVLATGSWDRGVRLRALSVGQSAPAIERAWGLTLAEVLAR